MSSRKTGRGLTIALTATLTAALFFGFTRTASARSGLRAVCEDSAPAALHRTELVAAGGSSVAIEISRFDCEVVFTCGSSGPCEIDMRGEASAHAGATGIEVSIPAAGLVDRCSIPGRGPCTATVGPVRIESGQETSLRCRAVGHEFETAVLVDYHCTATMTWD